MMQNNSNVKPKAAARRARRAQKGQAISNGNGPKPQKQLVPRNRSSLPSTGSVSAAFSRGIKMGGPRNVSRSKQSWRFVKRELVQNVTDAAAFTVTSLSINPGLAATFPWLASQAAKWEEYRFHHLQFEFITRSPTSATGSLVVAPDYDAMDPAPTTAAQITSYEDAVDDAYWKDQICVLRPESMFPMGPRKYVRSGVVSGDLKTYDVGRLHYAVEGTGTNVIGKLYVQYDIELFVPQVESSPTSEKTTVVTMISSESFATGVAEIITWDNFVVNPLGITVAGTGTFTLPAGAYLWSFIGTYADSAAETFLADVSVTGTAVGSTYQQQVRGAGVANQLLNVAIQGYAVSTGSNTLEVVTTLTGAAGTLSGPANQQSIVFRPA